MRVTAEEPVAGAGTDAAPPVVVVVGASAGGLAVLRRMLDGLPADLPAALLAAVHLPRVPSQRLADIVGPGCPFPVGEAGPSQPVRAGRLLVAPPDRHLAVVDGLAVQSTAPPVNGVRPSVDVLFTSAAAAYGPRVVAVVLSGAMRDGAAGAASVERAGGRVLVQDPADAAMAGMPASALAATAQHDVVGAAGLAEALARLVRDVAGRRA